MCFYEATLNSQLVDNLEQPVSPHRQCLQRIAIDDPRLHTRVRNPEAPGLKFSGHHSQFLNLAQMLEVL